MASERERVVNELRRTGWSEDEAEWMASHGQKSLIYAQARLRANLRELWRVVVEAFRRDR